MVVPIQVHNHYSQQNIILGVDHGFGQAPMTYNRWRLLTIWSTRCCGENVVRCQNAIALSPVSHHDATELSDANPRKCNGKWPMHPADLTDHLWPFNPHEASVNHHCSLIITFQHWGYHLVLCSWDHPWATWQSAQRWPERWPPDLAAPPWCRVNPKVCISNKN